MRPSSLKDWPGARPLGTAASQQAKLDEAQRKREKKKKGWGGVALYFITDFIFISWGLVVYFAFDKYV